jgi:2-keto-4-pentenoate hydratase
LANKLVRAFLKNKSVAPLPSRYVKNMKNAEKFRKLCESKITKPIIGYKAAGTGIPLIKKLGEKEPFYASVYKHNLIPSNSRIRINKNVLGIELEICYLISKNFFSLKTNISKKNIRKFITHIAPCIEIVGYRQRKKGIKCFGDLCSDFGGNVKFVIGSKTKFQNHNVKNLKTVLFNKSVRQSVVGNTNTVYIDPMNSLRFVLNKLQKDKVKYDKDFFVFTGSTVGVVPILSNSTYIGSIKKIGSVSCKIS